VKRLVPSLVALLALGGLATGANGSSNPPPPTFARGVPEDVRALTLDTWNRFVGAFPAETGCLSPLTLSTAWTLDVRARYVASRRLMILRIPGTGPNLRHTIVHEFAHHLDGACGRWGGIRPAFLRAQGLDPDSAWVRGRSWQDTPSEQFAEAVVEFVLGERPDPRIRIRPAALGALAAWAGGH
jgi:hypothetical protein